MIESILKSLSYVKEFGIIGYLALFLGVGIFLMAMWLVKHTVNSAEREREHNQKFLSEAVGANTKMMDVIAGRMGDIANLCERIMDNLARIESADKYQREEHKEIIMTLVQFVSHVKENLK